MWSGHGVIRRRPRSWGGNFEPMSGVELLRSTWREYRMSVMWACAGVRKQRGRDWERLYLEVKRGGSNTVGFGKFKIHCPSGAVA